MASYRPRAVVVGSGFGCRIQIPALRAAGFDVVGLVGSSLESARARATQNDVPQGFNDVGAAIAETQADAVAISVPPDLHCGLTLQAIERGCHVLCEKPFAMNADEARRMLDAAEAKRVAHAIGFEFRYDAQRIEVARALSAGLVGKPRLATFSQFLDYSSNEYVELPGWWFDPARGGGWLGAYGSHLVDWVHGWLGKFETVSAGFSSLTGPEGAAEDSFTVRFRTKAGLEGVFQQSSGSWGPPASVTRICGSAGTFWIENGVAMIADKDGTRELPISLQMPEAPDSATSQDPRRNSPEWQMLTSIELPPYTALCRDWLARIEGRPEGGLAPMPTFADGLKSMLVLDAIRASAHAGGAVTAVGQ